MKNIFYPLLATFILLTSATLSINSTTATKYKIDSKFQLKFTSKDPSGSFKNLTGSISFDKDDLANSKFSLTAKVSSINTGNGMQNKKAQMKEWFYASKYPNIKFVSTKIWKSESKYYMSGNFTIRGITKQYKVPMYVVKKDGKTRFKGSFYINRLDFKVGKADPKVPSKLKIQYSIPVTKI